LALASAFRKILRPSPGIPARQLQLKPCRSGLQQHHVAIAPLVSSQQLGCFKRWHSQRITGPGWSGDAPVLEFPANRHPQAKYR